MYGRIRLKIPKLICISTKTTWSPHNTYLESHLGPSGSVPPIKLTGYIAFIYAATEVSPVWHINIDLLSDTFHPWEAKLYVSKWAPPGRCGSPARPVKQWTGYLLSAELYRRVKRPRSRWIGPLNQIHWLWRYAVKDAAGMDCVRCSAFFTN